MQWSEDYLQAGDMRAHYTRVGAGLGKPILVLAHGFSDNGACWMALANDMAEQYDVVMPDARGHGLSDRVQRGQVTDLAGDLGAFLDAMGFENVILGGHSMGAGTAATLAGRRPELLRALILEDPAWREPQPQPAPELAGQHKPDPFTDWLLELRSIPIETIMARGRNDNPTWGEEEMWPWAVSKKQLDPNFTSSRTAWAPWREIARAITVPTLLITAECARGAIVTPEIAREAAALSPCIRVVNISGAGHCIRRENPSAYLAAIREFLAEVR